MQVEQARELLLKEWWAHSQLGKVRIGQLEDGVACITAVWYGPDSELPGVCGGYTVVVDQQPARPDRYTAG